MLSKASRQLADSREALAAASPIDPDSGMASPQYMQIHGEQLLSAAARYHGQVSVLIVGIDNFADIVRNFGRHVTDLIMRKLAKVLATKVRKEDTFSQIGDGQFAIITPDISLQSAEQFANRMRSVIAATAMQYRGQTLRISLNIGVANSVADGAESVSQMLGLAVARADIAHREGGNTVRSTGGEPQKFAWTAGIVSIERALLLIKSGAQAEIYAVGITLDRKAGRPGHGGGKWLRPAHAAKPAGQHPFAGQITVIMLPCGLGKGLIGALNDALATDVNPRSRRHLAVHHQAFFIELIEVVPSRPMGHKV